MFQDFEAKSEEDQKLIADIAVEFNLNKEQSRAFHIIANHAVSPESEQLKMYLGGMGGTGKSQVIKALIKFFESRNESHRIVVLGPTGTSAALLNGSTYHSFLGIKIKGEFNSNENVSIAQLQARLEGVDYIFIDEVSMIACHELYKISSQLAKAKNIFDMPFGGINMMFAGDFAQLAPVKGASLYSGSIGTQLISGLDSRGQESAIGKALWHQITTVVILRENMRQKYQSLEDAKLRTALENMRYAACTAEDIKFLKSRVAGKRPEQPKLAEKQFRNISIITALNSQRDKINQMGVARFAAENKQNLVDFHSIDHIGTPPDPSVKKKRGRKPKSAKSKDLNPWLQDVVWNLSHSSTEHFPGKLPLCIGMPVMLKNNDATELCITKGQEGFVAGWNAIKGPHGKPVLDTLFVHLDKPAKTVKIDGLPENVVPITKATKTVTCTYQSDLQESVERQQVWVLPNFAMTDYASQGKTRPANVVDLSYCRDHRSYYTCLSRSATASGTIIVQGFSPQKITCGASGYLRQEFREQELLDEITKLRYEGQLPDHIEGNLRNPLIRSYQKWKGTSYVPSGTHKALKWTATDPLPLLPVITDSPWQILKDVDTKKMNLNENTNEAITSSFIPAKGTVAISSKKRKLNEKMPVKSSKKSRATYHSNGSAPIGLIWDGDNYSCAYDALFTILYEIWSSDHKLWTDRFRKINRTMMKSLALGFKKYMENKSTFEDVRDKVRNQLHNKYKEKFPYGTTGTSVSALTSEMLFSKHVAFSVPKCSSCGYQGESVTDRLGFMIDSDQDANSTSSLLGSLNHETHDRCPDCGEILKQPIFFNETPNILAFGISSSNIRVSKKIKYIDGIERIELKLRGLIYYGGFHFTSRIISNDGIIWFSDGMLNGSTTVLDGKLDEMTCKDLHTCKGKKLEIAIYAQV